MTIHQTRLPLGRPRPKGYSNGVAAKGRMIFTGGIVGWDEAGRFETTLGEQFHRVLLNMIAVLHEAGAAPEHIVRMTCYVTDIASYRASLREIGAVCRELVGRNFPAMAVVPVKGLVEVEARIEIATTAFLPDAE